MFDYIHAHIPLLVSDLTEIRKIVEGYDVGLITTSHEPDKLAELMKAIVFDEVMTKKFKANTKRASEALTWTNETKVLDEIYG